MHFTVAMQSHGDLIKWCSMKYIFICVSIVFLDPSSTSA